MKRNKRLWELYRDALNRGIDPDNALQESLKNVDVWEEFQGQEEKKLIAELLKADLQKVMVNPLRDTIEAHGPITVDFVSSAAKRIAGALVTMLHNGDESEGNA